MTPFSLSNCSMRFLDSLFHEADCIEPCDVLKGKIMAALFLEPSTRTYVSFASAMIKLGGAVIPIESNSSMIKGESLFDTLKTLEHFCDVIVVRQSVSRALDGFTCSVPVINAGDGDASHVTQALLDLYTIHKEFGTIEGKTITFVNDLKHSRTVHSLVKLLDLFSDVSVNYVAANKELNMPQDLILECANLKQRSATLDEVLPISDVLYVTRIQKERTLSISPDPIVITPEILENAPRHMIVMHPFPRVNELAVEVDNDPRARYFQQMKNGLRVRMALLKLLVQT